MLKLSDYLKNWDKIEDVKEEFTKKELQFMLVMCRNAPKLTDKWEEINESCRDKILNLLVEIERR